MGSKYSYRPLIGREYEEPHGCLRLAEQVYNEIYGIPVGQMDEGITANDSRALYRLLVQQTVEVGEPAEGDLVLISSVPWHIGVYTGDGNIIHSYKGGAACKERLHSPEIWPNVVGYYRFSST